MLFLFPYKTQWLTINALWTHLIEEVTYEEENLTIHFHKL
jgi:hypothetical protein